jgi:hypothetical protein
MQKETRNGENRTGHHEERTESPQRQMFSLRNGNVQNPRQISSGLNECRAFWRGFFNPSLIRKSKLEYIGMKQLN